VKQRWFWLTISILLVVPTLFAMLYSMAVYPNHAPLKVGIDFTGGTILQYGVSESLSLDKMEDLRQKLTDIGIDSPVIQNINNESVTGVQENSNIANMVSIKTPFIGDNNTNQVEKITAVLAQEGLEPSLIQTNSVGPTLGKELLKNSLAALGLAFLGIVMYITLRFQLDYAIIVLLSLLHDAIFVVGIFSIFSLLFNTHVDGLFITAVLTVVGFSVHDTIVVFDRVRENNRFLAKKYTFSQIVNASVNQTLARSINTSLTTLLTLCALYFFGGSTTKDFVLVMILGIIVGTYSSIFFASVLLAWWHEVKDKKGVARA
jgi:preprotein translocase subunit SecF